MTFFFSVFFGAGVAAFLYSRLGRRVGYTNTKDVTILMAVIFVLSSAFFYTVLAFLIPKN